jgi:hypothetical protein
MYVSGYASSIILLKGFIRLWGDPKSTGAAELKV